jgi:uncharacterized repeat protein (TIGR04138 family)
MREEINFWETVHKIRSRDKRFNEEAYVFIIEALEYTLGRMERRRHISAKELLDGMVDYARSRYGMLSFAILESWGIRNTADIGSAVIHLVEGGILAKRESDSAEDFEDVCDLKEVLEEKYFE